MIYDHVSVSGIGFTCMNVEVRSPRTHIRKGKALYTDYEIELKTNNPCFPLLYSKTRRRYSEFVWLRGKLGLPDATVEGAPKLPRKQLIGRFKESFVQDRRDGLQRFLIRVLSINTFLQEPALQLFLQTNLTVPEIDHYIRTRTHGALKSLIVKLHDKSLMQKAQPRTTRKISKEYPITKRSLKKSCFGGRGWSSQYGDGYYSSSSGCQSDYTSDDVRQRSSTVNAGALPGGQLTLPSIPGSTDNLLPLSESDFTTTDDEVETESLHPLSRSWHGKEHDDIDFLLDDYEIIPFEIVTQIEEKHQEELKELGYLDLSTTMDELSSFGNEQDCFDY